MFSNPEKVAIAVGKMKKRKEGAGEEWPPLVPHPPSHGGQDLPDILPNIPPTRGKISSGSKDKVVTLEACSLNNAYRQLEQHGLQPVPVVSTHLCQDSPKMKVIQDHEQLDWDLMRMAVPRPKDKVMEGTNMEVKALDGPQPSSILYTGRTDRQKTVTMIKKKRKKNMTSAKKLQLKVRILFCGEKKKKPKKKKSKKKKDPKDGPKENPDNGHKEIPSLRKRKGKKKLARKAPETLDLSAEVIRYFLLPT